MKRLVTLGAAALALSLLACSPSSSKKVVVFWQFWPSDVVEPLIEKFEAEHPDIDVQMEQLTWQSGLEKITASIASGNAPDLCELGSTWMPRMLAAGALADWSAGVADLRPTLRGWSLCSIGDAIYGMPWVLGTRALFYNKELFERAGLDSSRAPETWDELRRAAEMIDALGDDVHGYGVQAGERYVLFKKFMPFAWGNGGGILSDDLSASVFNSQRNREALQFYVGLQEVGLLERQGELDRLFKEGKIGMQISGAWLFRSIPRDAPRLNYGVGLIPRPGAEHGTHASFAGGEVLVSFSASKNKAQALELARFLVRPENALALASAARSVQPATLRADTSAYYRDRPRERMMLRQFETALATPNHPAWVDIEAAIEDEVEEALYGKKTPAAAVKAASDRIDELAGQK